VSNGNTTLLTHFSFNVQYWSFLYMVNDCGLLSDILTETRAKHARFGCSFCVVIVLFCAGNSGFITYS